MRKEIQKLKEMKSESGNKLAFGGTQLTYFFKNGMGASVICHSHSYGGNSGLLELAVLGKDGAIDYSTSITNDVKGWLTAEDTVKLLEQIEKL